MIIYTPYRSLRKWSSVPRKYFLPGCCLVTKSHMTLWPHELQHARHLCHSFIMPLTLLKLMSVESVIPSHPLSSPSPPAFNLSQHQDLFKWVSSSHQVAKYSTFNQRENSVTPGRPFAQPAITGSMWQVARLPRTLLCPHCLLDADLRTTTHKEDSPGMPTSVCVLGCFWPAGSHFLTSQSACVTR